MAAFYACSLLPHRDDVLVRIWNKIQPVVGEEALEDINKGK